MKSMLKGRAFVVGVGMSKFQKPGQYSYLSLGYTAGQRALLDAGLPYSQMQGAICSYIVGDSCCGQRVLYHLGLTGIPIMNVNNNCCSGSTGLYLAQNYIRAGVYDCMLVLGFKQMQKGALKANFTDRVFPVDVYFRTNDELRGAPQEKFAPALFASAGLEHMQKYGTTREHLAKITQKNKKHSVNNPYSRFREECSIEDVLQSQMIDDPLTIMQCCPTTDGAAAAVLCSEEFVRKWELEDQAVEILNMELTSAMETTFSQKSSIRLLGYDDTRIGMKNNYEKTGLRAKDAHLIELHDCFSVNELLNYEALGLCDEGGAGQSIDRNEFTYGNKVVVNPSGGLLSKGHPIGATGIAQCAEISWHLRGMAKERQVKGATIGLQHNQGLLAGTVTGFYKKYNEKPQQQFTKFQSSCPDYLENLEKEEGLELPNFYRFSDS